MTAASARADTGVARPLPAHRGGGGDGADADDDPRLSEDGEFQVGEWLIVLLISLVVSAALFTFVVPNGGAVSALVLAIVALGRCWSSGRVSRCRSPLPQR